MTGAGNASWQKLEQAGWQALQAGLHRQAAGFYREARRAAEENHDELGRIKCLFWEGTCLSISGDPDTAMPLLLEAAQTASPEADPADVYNAMTWAISTAKEHKTVSFVRQLLSNARQHLERLGKESWGHMLYVLEGELAFSQSDFEMALRAQQRGWEFRNSAPDYPAYTRASHLKHLCRCAFALRDRDELTRWAEAIAADRSKNESDRTLASSARLLLLRSAEDRLAARSTTAEVARSVLRQLDTLEAHRVEEELSVLRALAVFGNHTEVERRLESLKPNGQGEVFGLGLLQGDFALCRARALLGMEPRDDEWDQDFPPPSPPVPGRDEALEHLKAARGHFEETLPVARQEDERLETSFYTQTLEGRLERTRALRQAVEITPDDTTL